MKKLISVILAGVMMAGLCACGKEGSVKETKDTAKETTKETAKETVESETEDSSGEKTESSNPNLLVLDEFSDQEIFDLCHETIRLTIVDGESVQSLIDRLPSARYGAKPYKWSYRIVGLTFDYSVSLDGKDYDHLEEVDLSLIYDDEADVLKNLGPDNNIVRSGTVKMFFYSDRGQSLYEFLKSKYTEMYPGAKIENYTSEEYDEFTILCENYEYVGIRIEHTRTGSRITVSEGQYNVNRNKTGN